LLPAEELIDMLEPEDIAAAYEEAAIDAHDD
jgi:hypothetical protein